MMALKLARAALADQPGLGGRRCSAGPRARPLAAPIWMSSGRRSRARPRVRWRAPAGGAACFALSERVRRLARGRARPLLAGGRRAPARGARSRRTSRCATSRSTRSPSRSRAERRSTRSEASTICRARRLRMAGAGAFADDPLRVLRLVRVAVELDLAPDAATVRAAARRAGALARVSARAGVHGAASDRLRAGGAARARS